LYKKHLSKVANRVIFAWRLQIWWYLSSLQFYW